MQSLRKLLFLALALVALGATALFATRNQALVEIDYVLGRSAEHPLWLTLAVAVLCGALLATLAGVVAVSRARLRERQQRRRADRLAGELHRLRNLPIQSDGPEDVATVSTSGGGGASDEAWAGSGRRP